MNDYISKQAAIDLEPPERYERQYQTMNLDDAYESGWYDAQAGISQLPPADVRPVVRGRWEMDSDGIPHCTECGYVAPQRLFLQLQSFACTTQFIMSNYCPDCGSYNGADMRGGDAE